MPTVDEVRRANLQLLVAEWGGVQRLAERVGVSPSQLSQWLNASRNSRTGKPRGMWPVSCRRIEQATGKPDGWMDAQHAIAGEEAASYEVAQDLSQSQHSDALPLIAWESLMQPLPAAVFRTVLADDALAPEYPAGTEVVWSVNRRVMPGRLVLVRDSRGQVHARRCQQGREPGRWTAAPANSAYVALDSVDDALQVLAVFKGRLEPDDR